MKAFSLAVISRLRLILSLLWHCPRGLRLSRHFWGNRSTAAKTNIIAGLDIGSSKVDVVIAEYLPEGALSVIGVGSSQSKGLRKGVVINIDATVECIAAAYRFILGAKSQLCLASPTLFE